MHISLLPLPLMVARWWVNGYSWAATHTQLWHIFELHDPRCIQLEQFMSFQFYTWWKANSFCKMKMNQ